MFTSCDSIRFTVLLFDWFEESSSFRTFAGTIQTIESTNPLWILLENVDMGDCSDDDSNGAVVARVLSDLGFEARPLANELVIP